MINDRVLVAIMNNHRDFRIASRQCWYRIPVENVERWLQKRWPPAWLAFYLTKIFKDDAFSVRYYGKITGIRKAGRRELFPDEPSNPKSDRRYYRLEFEPLQILPQPIFSRRRRRIIFITTTWEKFIRAVEINDLYDESPLEDRLWAEMKRLEIPAERQELVNAQGQNYFLDFAVYCAGGELNLETDGDTWHCGRERIVPDNIRDNALETGGWKILRFNTMQIQEQMADYCVPLIVENINKLGGVTDSGKNRKIITEINRKGGQFELF